MPLLTDRLSLQPSLSVLVSFLFLMHICKASDAISCPAISLLGIDRSGGVNLNCESKGWQEAAWVIWLDAVGNPLPAEDTETVRGPDDLYTVSSRVTVEKRHSNSFTCRVQQNQTNQIRETQIYIADDFFDIQSSSSSTTIGLAAGLVACILVILSLSGFILWNYKTKRSHRDQTIAGENENHSQSNRSEERVVTGEETETQPLMTQQNVQMEVLNKEEQQQREAAEKSLKTLKAELESKNTELRKKESELQQLREKKKKEENLKSQKKQLENKNTEIEDKQAEVQQLQKEIQEMEANLQNLTEKLESNNLERNGAAVGQPSSSTVEGNVN